MEKGLEISKPWSGSGLGDLLGNTEILEGKKMTWNVETFLCLQLPLQSTHIWQIATQTSNTDRSSQHTCTRTCTYTCHCTITVKMHAALSLHRSTSVDSLWDLLGKIQGAK